MQTRIAGICKQSGWIQKLPGICIPQLHTECIQELLAFVNRRAEYRNCQALHIAITYSMSTTIAGICKQSGWIQWLSGICIPQLHTQCIPELLAFVNNRAEYRNCQAFVYRNCRLNVYRNCWHCKQAGWIQELPGTAYGNYILNVYNNCWHL